VVRPISAAETRPLRHLVLRPDKPAEALVYPGDDHPEGLHLGAFDEAGGLVGVATLYPEAPPDEHFGEIPAGAYEPGAAFRLRGMATRPDVRGARYGRALMEGCFSHVRLRGGEYLWCNARLVAVEFYRAMGLETFGEEFEIDPIGPHYVMGRPV
jgi:GNAT superfamily N-acetyltransferase